MSTTNKTTYTGVIVPDDEDMRIVMEKCNVGRYLAEKTLEECKGSVLDAISALHSVNNLPASSSSSSSDASAGSASDAHTMYTQSSTMSDMKPF